MRRLALILTTFALLVAGCGGDDDTETDTGATEAQPTATATEEAGGTASGGETVTITMKNIQFDPAEAEVAVGQKVVWPNEDDAPHNVVGGPIESETYGKGESFTFTPEEPGTIEYVCTIHPGMQGKLIVTEG